MPKELGTYAVFDVAKEAFLSLVADWRLARIKPVLDASMTGEFTRCANSEDPILVEWRQNSVSAKLLSICSHGGQRSIEGCSEKIYIKDALTFVDEVPGAVIHLLACETMPGLGQALVAAGAEAVIGYDEPFSFFTDAEEVPSALPTSTKAALECDAQVLLALAEGKNVSEAIGVAKAWANEEALALAKIARHVMSEPRAYRNAVWRLATLTNNSAHLKLEGSATATVTRGMENEHRKDTSDAHPGRPSAFGGEAATTRHGVTQGGLQ